MKRFEYSPLGKDLKTQTEIAKKQYQGLNKCFKSDEKEEPALKKCNKSNLNIDFTNIILIVKNLITFLSNQSICFLTNFLTI